MKSPVALLTSLLGPRTLLSLHLVFYVSLSYVHYHRSYSSVGKDSACNAGDLSLIPGWGRAAGEGISYPLQYSWASLVAQLLKNLPAMWETWVRSLGREHPLEKGTAPYSRILAWRIPWVVRTMGLQRARRHRATCTLTLGCRILLSLSSSGTLSCFLLFRADWDRISQHRQLENDRMLPISAHPAPPEPTPALWQS